MSDANRAKRDDLQPQQEQALQGGQAAAGADKAQRGSPYKQNQALQFKGAPAMEAAGPAPSGPAAPSPGAQVDIPTLLQELEQKKQLTAEELKGLEAELAQDREALNTIQAQLSSGQAPPEECLQRFQDMGLEAETPRQLIEQGIEALNGEILTSEELLPQYTEDLEAIEVERAELEVQQQANASA